MRLLLHAPNVHTGGGLVLLRELLETPALESAWLQLDARVQGRLALRGAPAVRYVPRSILSRFLAEWHLWRASRADSLTLCFHGMPPWFPLRGRVVVFQQNRNLLGLNGLGEFPRRVAARIGIERIICRLFRHHVDAYVVQTQTMARTLADWHGGAPRIRIIPFAGSLPAGAGSGDTSPEHDFLYVASGDGHKNHARLLEAWALLAGEGLFPTLALTVEAGNTAILEHLERARAAHGVRVENFPDLSRDGIFSLYRRSRALIYPSTGESFGLPLLEAAACGLPIVAAERDYVRDLVVPVESFDPDSAVSIARAVRRFLGAPQATQAISTARGFMEEVLQA